MLKSNSIYVRWLVDHDKSGQAVHSGSFAPTNGTFRATDTGKCQYAMLLCGIIEKKKENNMKRIVAFILICFNLTLVFGQELDIKNQKIVQNFIETIKTKNKEKICSLVSYPLTREYPIPEVKNKNELLKRFDEIFDTKLLTLIIKSKVKTDWSEMGWRGIMLLEGEVWLNSTGRLIAVNYQSQFEKKKKEELITIQKNVLPESLRNFIRPICILETSKYRIRIDDMGHDKYRYASWRLQQNMSEKPEVLLLNGKVEFDGSGGNHSYIFKSGEYTYECGIVEMGEDGAPPAYLTITKGEKEILSQNAKIKK